MRKVAWQSPEMEGSRIMMVEQDANKILYVVMHRNKEANESYERGNYACEAKSKR